MRVLLTGARGFIGASLIQCLNDRGAHVSGISRGDVNQTNSQILLSDLDGSYSHHKFDIRPDADWRHLLENKDVVVHLADGFNRFEHLPTNAHDDRALERRDATLNLVRQSIEHGVSSFIYLSTIKAMCGTWANNVLTENSTPHPASLYGRLKLETEQAITKLAEGSKTRVIILRFPVVFGDKPDGNFTHLLHLADTSLPLPFEVLENRRSMISLQSLTDAIARVTLEPMGGSGIYLVHDGAVSIAQLITHLRIGLARPRRLFAMPPSLWPLVEAVPGIGEMVLRFTRPLELDDGKFRKNFSWSPPINMGDELQATARTYRRSLDCE